MNIFLISDTHFGHSNIIKYENRPFNNAEEMDEIMITNWNSVVKNGDKIFHLGDIIFKGNKENSQKLLNRLNGDIILIKGNHDNHSNSWYRDCGINEVYSCPILYSEFYLLSHYPIYINENTPFVNIHGHIHSSKYVSNGYDNQEGHFNVSVEVLNYTPINFDEIKQKYNFEGAKK